jgi:ribosomal protein L37AE/L43A
MATESPKPSRPENEYFARSNAELVHRIQEERRRAHATEERASHRMRCPRCGGSLVERPYQSLRIDVCDDCGGTWLDKGDLEVLQNIDRSALRRFVSDLIYGFPH